jgi:EpsI family protein
MQAGWRPTFVGADREWQAAYGSNGAVVTVCRNVYPAQEVGRELVASQNALVPTSTWRLLRAAQSAGEANLPGRAQVAVGLNEQWLLTSWYEVNDATATSDFGAKLLHAVQRLRRLPDRSGIVVVAAGCDTDCSFARAAMGRFLASTRWFEQPRLGADTAQPRHEE